MQHTAFRCLDCKVISVFPTRVSDSRRCLECGGFITGFGRAEIYGKRISDNFYHSRVWKKIAKVQPQRISEMNIDVEVNTKQLDKALKKAKKLAKVIADINMEINNLGNE